MLSTATMLYDDFFQNSSELLPNTVHAFYKKIEYVDLREGMNNIIAFDHWRPVNKNSGYQEQRRTIFLGTIKSIEENNNKANITGYIPGEEILFDTFNEGRIYDELGARMNYFATEYFQEYLWSRIIVTEVTNVDHFAGKVIRFDAPMPGDDTGDSHMTTTFNVDDAATTARQWINVLLAEVAKNPDKRALYVLEPQMEKPQRELENIPPMPGEKPQPPKPEDVQPDEAQPKEDDIPPMPGTHSSVTDKDMRTDNTGKLKKSWWGTTQGEGK